MSLISRMRKQDAVFWEKTGDDAYGQPVLADPVAIKCRWDDTTEEFIDSKGTTRQSRAKVYPDTDTAPGGVLMLGNLASVNGGIGPKEHDGAFEIRRFDRNPNIRATEFLLTAYL